VKICVNLWLKIPGDGIGEPQGYQAALFRIFSCVSWADPPFDGIFSHVSLERRL